MSIEIVAGFKAYYAGEPRDTTRSAEWLEGYDGAIAGIEETAARKAELDAICAKIKIVRRRTFPQSMTPRSL